MSLQKYENIETGGVYEAVQYTQPGQVILCHEAGNLLQLGDWVILVRKRDDFGGDCFSIMKDQQFKTKYKLWNSSSCNSHGKLTRLNSTLRQALEQCFKKLKVRLANS